MVDPIPGMMIEDQPESVVLRLLAWGEARNQGAAGIAAVLWVVRNRALKRDTTLKKEALRKWQFSCFNDNDPNRAKMLSAHLDDPKGWAVVDTVTQLFDQGHLHDPTLGSTHYFVANMPVPPAWSRPENGWQHRVRLGAHEFGVAA